MFYWMNTNILVLFYLYKFFFKFCIAFIKHHMHNPIFSLTVIVATTLSTSFVFLLFHWFLNLLWFHELPLTQICTNLHTHFHIYLFSSFPWENLDYLSLGLALLDMHYTFLDLTALPCLQELCRGSKSLALVVLCVVLGVSPESFPLGLCNAQSQPASSHTELYFT